MNRPLLLILSVLLSGSLSGPAEAAEPVPAEVAAVLEHAAAQGLPVGPLVAKAQEGLAKGVPPVRIAGALSQLEASMAATAAALEGRLSASDPAGHLAAGSAALSGGSSDAALRAISDQSPEHRVVATRTYADLLVHGFSEPQALSLVGGAARGPDAGLSLAGLSTTAASLVASGLSPTIVTTELEQNPASGSKGKSNGPPDHSNAGGNGNGNGNAYGHDK